MYPYDQPEFAAFVHAIRTEPDDDTARLVCADWLEEHGAGARSAFVRGAVMGQFHKSYKLAFRQVRNWFTFGAHEPNVAAGTAESVTYYPAGSEGDFTTKSGQMSIRGGFGANLYCGVGFLIANMDAAYHVHPVSKITVTHWEHEGPDGFPVIRNTAKMDKLKGNLFTVAGRDVWVNLNEATNALPPNEPGTWRSYERRVAELTFAARWPGIKFTVLI